MEHHSKKRFACSTSAHVRAHSHEFGKKVITLALLEEAGYRVPEFVAVPSRLVHLIARGDLAEAELDELALSAHEQIGASSYAVRSGAFAEDGARASHAGEFLTLLDVAPQDIKSAILEVVRDASQKWETATHRAFSVIIQKYISADHAGVVFTRDPRGGREAIIEWRKGRGAEVVGGEKVSRMYVNDDACIIPERFPGSRELFTTTRKIEEFFDAPQDIEWAMSGGVLYILQSRLITTLSPNALQAYREIDAQFKGCSHYYLSRGGIGESFEQCTPLAYDLLARLYAPSGPIARAYASIGVTFVPADILSVHHGVLYVDQERELAQFFPAYAYVNTSRGLVPRIVRFRGLMKTLQHAFLLSRLHAPAPEDLEKKLQAHLARIRTIHDTTPDDVGQLLAQLLTAYEDIFLINLYSEHVFRRAERVLIRVPFSFTTLLTIPFRGIHVTQANFIPHALRKLIVGNSLNIGDRTPFIERNKPKVPQEALITWWNGLSKRQQRAIGKEVLVALEYQQLRESGRQLTVLALSMLRRAFAKKVSDADLIYFGTINELSEKKITTSELRERKKIFEKTHIADMPKFIASAPPPVHDGMIGVSPGIATGVIDTEKERVSRGGILLTERLTPDLAPMLAHVGGIIGVEGGLLSHMAILAREAGVPVVIDPHARTKITPGMTVTIDGGEGTIVVSDNIQARSEELK